MEVEKSKLEYDSDLSSMDELALENSILFCPEGNISKYLLLIALHSLEIVISRRYIIFI